ncbi:unnamed protein product [Cylindrotheca closterium]|uniref:Apoptosis-antagonizing transcription factor C-terminal domain-containing protein n=1 Tax=Cylindrotheca closterium TaxID=2856 RepID=A0AAD2CC84_9STRA|nr:unnamed protein product [Cylindrotheca closterium]
MKKKRNLSVFDAIQELESDDVKAEKKRRKRTTTDRLRAEAAQSQSKVYNHLVECRILLQRATTSVGEEEQNDAVEQDCNTLLKSLLQARSKLVSGDPDVDGKYEDVVNSSCDDLDAVLQEEYEACRDIWKTVLNKRHNNLKLHSGLTAKSQFKVMDSSFWEQVEGTMEYEGLRENDDQKDTFDDSKVYQQLLKDFVATSANANSATPRPEKSSKNSKKKQVDRGASKGRKIRYKEIPKLVNFTFPLSRNNTSNLNQDEWFQSLFGGAGSKKS